MVIVWAFRYKVEWDTVKGHKYAPGLSFEQSGVIHWDRKHTRNSSFNKNNKRSEIHFLYTQICLYRNIDVDVSITWSYSLCLKTMHNFLSIKRTSEDIWKTAKNMTTQYLSLSYVVVGLEHIYFVRVLQMTLMSNKTRKSLETKER